MEQTSSIKIIPRKFGSTKFQNMRNWGRLIPPVISKGRRSRLFQELQIKSWRLLIKSRWGNYTRNTYLMLITNLCPVSPTRGLSFLRISIAFPKSPNVTKIWSSATVEETKPVKFLNPCIKTLNLLATQKEKLTGMKEVSWEGSPNGISSTSTQLYSIVALMNSVISIIQTPASRLIQSNARSIFICMVLTSVSLSRALQLLETQAFSSGLLTTTWL